MKLPQYRESGLHWKKAALPACILGLLFCPLAYVVIGALSGFSFILSAILIPPLLISTGYLTYSYIFSETKEKTSWIKNSIEGICWVIIIFFIYVISNFTLFTLLERVGFFALLYFITNAIFIIFTLFYKTNLEDRLGKIPESISLMLSALIILTVVSLGATYLLTNSSFI